jgi:hypothetical protein
MVCGAAALASLAGCASSSAPVARQHVSLAAPALPLGPDPAYANFPRYVGTLGSRQIEMKLGSKTDDATGLHGEYRFIGSPARFLVAGDRDGDTLQIEESDDGTRISGNWVGQFAADGSISGERMNDDDSNSQPFELRLQSGAAPAAPAAPAATAAPAAARPRPPGRPALDEPPAQPAPAAEAPSNAVGGTSNVIIGN